MNSKLDRLIENLSAMQLDQIHETTLRLNEVESRTHLVYDAGDFTVSINEKMITIWHRHCNILFSPWDSSTNFTEVLQSVGINKYIELDRYSYLEIMLEIAHNLKNNTKVPLKVIEVFNTCEDPKSLLNWIVYYLKFVIRYKLLSDNSIISIQEQLSAYHVNVNTIVQGDKEHMILLDGSGIIMTAVEGLVYINNDVSFVGNKVNGIISNDNSTFKVKDCNEITMYRNSSGIVGTVGLIALRDQSKLEVTKKLRKGWVRNISQLTVDDQYLKNVEVMDENSEDYKFLG